MTVKYNLYEERIVKIERKKKSLMMNKYNIIGDIFSARVRGDDDHGRKCSIHRSASKFMVG